MKINNMNIVGNQKKLNFEYLDDLKTLQNTNNERINKALSFDEMISDSIFSNIDIQMKEVLKEIEKQKEKLIKDTSLTEFRRYKSLITEFIQIINNKSKLKEQIFFDNVGRQKVLKKIDKIDNKMQALQKEFLNNNKNDINIINLVEEVKGLIVDTVV